MDQNSLSEEISQQFIIDQQSAFDYQKSDEEDSQLHPQHSLLKIQKISIKKMPPFIRQIWLRRQHIDYAYLSKQIKLPQSQKISKEVCAKLLKPKDLVVQCFNCRFDSSCIMCMECFENSNHEEHKYVIRAANGGCCDCGDKEAWKEEGFCTRHSGTFKNFSIDQEILNIVKSKLQGLFYLYFYLNIREKNNSHKYSESLVEFLKVYNINSPYYNKITALVLTSSLSKEYFLNQTLNSTSILENILTFSMSQDLIRNWLELFILMFSYYPFKQQLVRVYIQKYGKIMDGSELSYSRAGQISCQLLSSYELIQKYCDMYNIGLGQQSPVPPLKKLKDTQPFRRYYIRLYNDLAYFNKLSGNIPFKYWKMHINSKESLDNIFKFYDTILQFEYKLEDDGLTSLEADINLVEIIRVENEVITNFTHIMKIIKSQRRLTEKIIKFLWEKCTKYAYVDPQKISFFRTYERCFALALFTYFDCSLENISKGRQYLLKQILQIPSMQFSQICSQILLKILRTFLIYPKANSQPGYAQSIYAFQYFYKIRFHTLAQTDIVAIKLFLLLTDSSKKLIDPFYIANFNAKIQWEFNAQKMKASLKKKKLHLNNILTFIRYLYINQIPEIYMAYKIDKETKFYSKQVDEFMERIFNQSKGTVSLQKINLIDTKIFEKDVSPVKPWVKENCIFNKDKKQFVLKEPMKDNAQNGINWTDIWQNSLLEQNIKYSDPFKTKQLIQGYNIQIFDRIWNKKLIIKLVEIITELYKYESEGMETVLENILHIYLMKRDKQQSSLLKYELIMKNIVKIPIEILDKFKQFKEIKEKMSEQTNLKQIEEKQEKERRKTKMEEMKLKKMQKMKERQNKVMSNFNELDEQVVPEKMLPKKMSLEEQNMEQHKDVCCVCRNQQTSKLVYLVSIEKRNHQKLLGLGSGLNCYSFYSCYHTFDYHCIKDQFTGIQSKNSIKCPLCKTKANFLLPVCPQEQQQSVLDLVFNKIYAILLTIQSDKKQLQNFYEEMAKSFYHYAIIGLIDPKSILKKRTYIYRNLLTIMKKLIKEKEIQELTNKLLRNDNKNKGNNRINLNPQKFVKTKKICKQNELKILSRDGLVRKKKEYQAKSQEMRITQKQDILQHNTLYQQVIKTLLHLLSSKNQLNKETQMQKQENNDRQKFVQVFFKLLFDQKVSQEQKNFLFEFTPMHIPPVIRKLPKKYAQIRPLKKCFQCQRISAHMTMCLLCNWIGCQKCPQGNSSKHNQLNHGGAGVFMFVQSSVLYYQTSLGISRIGVLYQNDWGSSLLETQNWQQFELNSNRIKTVQSTLLHDKHLIYKQK